MPRLGSWPQILSNSRSFETQTRRRLGFVVIAFALSGLWLSSLAAVPVQSRVLVLSIDGLHAFDLANYTKADPNSALATLVSHGFNYTAASAVSPADSFPGNLAVFTGGTPVSTGVYFDRSYDRSLWPPGATSGPLGTPVIFDESVDLNLNALDGGGGLNPDALPRDPARGGAVVYPHNYLRVNTVFEIIRAAGRRTAWCDKHLTDEILLGPSGQGIQDLYLLEIAARNESGIAYNKSVDATKAYDDLKVKAILNEIGGMDHSGSNNVGVPAIFGMNFQAVSVAQKIKTNKGINGDKLKGTAAGPGGYLDGQGTPSFLVADALAHTDASIRQILNALTTAGLMESTLVVLTSKHGQSPVDPSKLNLVGPQIIPNLIEPVSHVLQITADDAALIWIEDPSLTPRVVDVLLANQTNAFIQDLWSGESLKLHYPDPQVDPRTPNIIVLSQPGTIYTTANKIAEHGGFTDQDLSVPLVISNPHLPAQTIRTPVQTTQIAPTILALLGLDPFALQAVVIEKTQVLPGFEAAELKLIPGLTTALGITGSPAVQLSHGQAQFQVTAHAQPVFLVEASDDLAHWTSVGTNTVSMFGSLRFSDPQALSGTNRFYRAVLTP